MDESYSRYYRELWYRHWWWRARHRLVLRQVSQLLGGSEEPPASPLILDIGCCGGVTFDDLSRFGTVHGLEPDPLLVDNEPRWRHCIEQAAFGPEYRSPRRYDLILMLDVLEHIEDDAGAVANLYRMLAPGGYLLLTVPALHSLWSVHDEVNHHYRRYHRQELDQLMLSRGFEIVRSRYLFSWSLGLVYLRKWLSPRRTTQYRVRVPMAPINALCHGLTAFEERLVQFTGLRSPAGSSLMVVARRPAPLAQKSPSEWAA